MPTRGADCSFDQGSAISSHCHPVSVRNNRNANNVFRTIRADTCLASLVPLSRSCPASESSTSYGAVEIRRATTSGSQRISLLDSHHTTRGSHHRHEASSPGPSWCPCNSRRRRPLANSSATSSRDQAATSRDVISVASDRRTRQLTWSGSSSHGPAKAGHYVWLLKLTGPAKAGHYVHSKLTMRRSAMSIPVIATLPRIAAIFD